MEIKKYKAPLTIKIIHFALMLSCCLFVGIAYYLDLMEHSNASQNPFPFPAHLLGAIPAIIAVVLKIKFLGGIRFTDEEKKSIDDYIATHGKIDFGEDPSGKGVIKGPGADAISRFIPPLILVYGLIEAITIFGFVAIFLDKMTLPQLLVNLSVSIILYLLFNPSREFTNLMQK